MTKEEHKNMIEDIKHLVEMLDYDMKSALYTALWERAYDIGDDDSVDMNTKTDFFLTGRDENECCIKITHTLTINDIKNIAYDADLIR